MIFNILLCFLIEGAWGDLILSSHMKLGAGTSAFQSEGAWNVDGKTPSILDTYYRSNKSKHEPGEACKSYELYERDVEMAKNLGLQFYRFSLAWTRILPEGFSHNINEAGVKHYNNLINKLVANGIEPVVTLLHFDFPQCLQDLGGWNNTDSQDWFAEYARTAFSLFGDRVKTWITINEPLMATYDLGLKTLPKGHHVDPHQYAKNMLLAHAKAWRVYDEEFRSDQKGMVSIVNQMFWFIPASEEDEEVTELAKQLSVGLFSHAIYSKEGGWPKDLQKALAENEKSNPLPEFTDEEIEIMRGAYDFYGLNFYTSKLVRKVKEDEEIGEWPMKGSSELGIVLETSPDWPKPEGAMAITPEGIRSTLLWLNTQYGVKKFFITENGISSKGEMDDVTRCDYIYKHLERLCLAENYGLKIIGYSVWNIMDGFEFMGGYKSKFGLYSVNFTDPMRARTPRKSAHYYKSIISNSTSGLPIASC